MASSDLCASLRDESYSTCLFLRGRALLTIAAGAVWIALLQEQICSSIATASQPGDTYRGLSDNYSDHSASGCQGQAGLPI